MTAGRPDMRPEEKFSQRITPQHPSGDLEYSLESIKNPGLSVWLEKCAACPSALLQVDPSRIYNGWSYPCRAAPHRGVVVSIRILCLRGCGLLRQVRLAIH